MLISDEAATMSKADRKQKTYFPNLFPVILLLVSSLLMGVDDNRSRLICPRYVIVGY